LALSLVQRRNAGEKGEGRYTIELEEEWIKHVMMRAGALARIRSCTPRLVNSEGEINVVKSEVEQMKSARRAIWGQGVGDYVRILGKWRANRGCWRVLRLSNEQWKN